MENNPDSYILLTDLELSQLNELGDIIYQGKESGLFGNSWKIALSAEQMELACSSDSFGVLQGPPELLDSLKRLSGYQLSNMWISLQFKEQFIQRATEQVKSEVANNSKVFEERENLAKVAADEISNLVNDAAKDVTYFMAQAPFFEFTILADGDYDDTLDEILQILAPIM